jgi:hypothetical protein
MDDLSPESRGPQAPPIAMAFDRFSPLTSHNSSRYDAADAV